MWFFAYEKGLKRLDKVFEKNWDVEVNYNLYKKLLFNKLSYCRVPYHLVFHNYLSRILSKLAIVFKIVPNCWWFFLFFQFSMWLFSGIFHLQVLLTGFRSLPPLFADTPNAVQELTIASNTLHSIQFLWCFFTFSLFILLRCFLTCIFTFSLFILLHCFLTRIFFLIKEDPPYQISYEWILN